MYSRPKFLGLNSPPHSITYTFVVFYATSKTIYIINIHCFWAIVEIPCSEKSAKSETSNYGLRYLFFFQMPLQKNVKSRVFWLSCKIRALFGKEQYRLWLACKFREFLYFYGKNVLPPKVAPTLRWLDFK